MHGKISPTMYTGSMVGAGAMAFALMPYCIANARPDDNCTVDLNPQVLAAVFGETKEAIQAAIGFLTSPDPLSRSKDSEGRRLMHVGPGPFRYKVVNLQRYRDDISAELRREYWRQHKAWARGCKRGEFVFDPNLSTKTVDNKANVRDLSTLKDDVHSNVQATDAGTVAGASASKKKAEKLSSPSPNPEHKAFIDGWCLNFRALHGVDYMFSGGRDARSVKELLSLGILRIDLLEIAKQAWVRHVEDPRAWGCGKAITIHGFKQYLNEIRTELKNGIHSKTNSRHPAENPRNAGTYPTTTDYAAVLARREAKALARQVAENNGHSPGTQETGI